MRIINKMSLLLLFIYSTSIGFVYANETFSTLSPNSYDTRNPQGFWLFIGSNFGAVDVQEDISANDQDGHQMNFKVLGSIYKPDPNFIFDIGLGYQSNNTENKLGTNQYRTRSLFIDGSARYRFHPSWQIGPVVNMLIGKNNSFVGDGQSFATFLGAGVHYETPLNSTLIFRVGGRALTDLDVSDRQVNKFLLDFQIGFAPLLKSETTFDASVPAYDSELVAEDFESEFQEEPQPLVRVRLDDISYKSGQVTPNYSTKSYLENLANIMVSNQKLFEQVGVTGHANMSGAKNKVKTNRILSHSRAKDILKRFTEGGLPVSKIKSQGSIIPLPKKADLLPEAFRKVELEFSGVKDEKALREAINSIRQ